jgi:hypothetical protein
MKINHKFMFFIDPLHNVYKMKAPALSVRMFRKYLSNGYSLMRSPQGPLWNEFHFSSYMSSAPSTFA